MEDFTVISAKEMREIPLDLASVEAQALAELALLPPILKEFLGMLFKAAEVAAKSGKNSIMISPIGRIPKSEYNDFKRSVFQPLQALGYDVYDDPVEFMFTSIHLSW